MLKKVAALIKRYEKKGYIIMHGTANHVLMHGTISPAGLPFQVVKILKKDGSIEQI